MLSKLRHFPTDSTWYHVHQNDREIGVARVGTDGEGGRPYVLWSLVTERLQALPLRLVPIAGQAAYDTALARLGNVRVAKEDMADELSVPDPSRGPGLEINPGYTVIYQNGISGGPHAVVYSFGTTFESWTLGANYKWPGGWKGNDATWTLVGMSGDPTPYLNKLAQPTSVYNEYIYKQ